MTYPKLYDNANSLSHRGDFARVCVELWEQRSKLGTYNVANKQWITTRDVGALLRQYRDASLHLRFFENEDHFYKEAAVTPRSNAIMSVDAVTSLGIDLLPIQEALERSLINWSQ